MIKKHSNIGKYFEGRHWNLHESTDTKIEAISEKKRIKDIPKKYELRATKFFVRIEKASKEQREAFGTKKYLIWCYKQ